MYYLRPNYKNEAGYYSAVYLKKYYDGYGYNFYYGKYGYYQNSAVDIYVESNVGGTIAIIIFSCIGCIGLSYICHWLDKKVREEEGNGSTIRSRPSKPEPSSDYGLNDSLPKNHAYRMGNR